MYSQASQDIFVDLIYAGRDPASLYFVDIGAGYDKEEPINSNTLLLEQKGWNGVAIDGDGERLFGRKNPAVHMVGSSPLSECLDRHGVPLHVQYLTIDIEGFDFDALKEFIASGRSFEVLTIEHNLYSGVEGVVELKKTIFDFMTSEGYVRFANNVGDKGTLKNLHIGYQYEDWYVNPLYLNPNDIDSMLKALP